MNRQPSGSIRNSPCPDAAGQQISGHRWLLLCCPLAPFRLPTTRGEPGLALGMAGGDRRGAMDGMPRIGGLRLLVRQIALIPFVLRIALCVADKVARRREVGAPATAFVAPPDRGIEIIRLTRLTRIAGVIGGAGLGFRSGIGGETDKTGGLGAYPLLAGPARAVGGIEIGRVDALPDIGVRAQPAIGAGERADRGEIVFGGFSGERAEPGGEEQAGAGGRGLLRDQIKQLFEIGGGEAHGGGVGIGASGVGALVEAVEHFPRQDIVVAQAGGDAAVVGGDILPHAVEGAVHQLVGEHIARVEQRRIPAEPKGGAARAGAQRIGRLARHIDDVTGLADIVPARQGDEEALLLLRGPAVIARGIGDAGFELVEGGVVEGEIVFGGDRVHVSVPCM